MFESVAMAPPDPMLELYEAYQQDTRTDKINLCIGIYQNENGATPILRCVKEAEAQLIASETTKSYLSIGGDPGLGRAVERLLLGADHPILQQGRLNTLHTAGGCAALRVAGELSQVINPGATIWLSDPAWANYHQMFTYMGATWRAYPYYNAAEQTLNFDAMLATLQSVPAGDMVLLQAGCHNPTGADLTLEQWAQVIDVAATRGFLPLMDVAYQGFKHALVEDAAPARMLVEREIPCLISYSFSKNMGLYNERVGALSIVTRTPDELSRMVSQAKACIRAMYSNPPAHGAAIVKTVVHDDGLYQTWQNELKMMRDQLKARRDLLLAHLKPQGLAEQHAFIGQQYGMFSILNLNLDQIDTLRKQHGIYVVNSGRISLPGINQHNVERLCAALAEVMA